MSNLNNRLAVLANQISEAHADCRNHAEWSAERAVEAGHLLLEAKVALEHGQWLPWLRETGVGVRTAQGYMRLAKSGMKSATVAHLGLRAALESIAEPQDDPPPLLPPGPGKILRVTARGPNFEASGVYWASIRHPGNVYFVATFLGPQDSCVMPSYVEAFKHPLREDSLSLYIRHWLSKLPPHEVELATCDPLPGEFAFILEQRSHALAGDEWATWEDGQ